LICDAVNPPYNDISVVHGEAGEAGVAADEPDMHEDVIVDDLH
jgi:hypothetical protein